MGGGGPNSSGSSVDISNVPYIMQGCAKQCALGENALPKVLAICLPMTECAEYRVEFGFFGQFGGDSPG
jgi:hypothetical protein